MSDLVGGESMAHYPGDDYGGHGEGGMTGQGKYHGTRIIER